GAFGVKAGAPIVVPPSVGTLFVGTAHRELIPNGKKNETAEVITLSLTFDHRVVNGAGAANFVHEIKQQIEAFKIPAGGTRADASVKTRVTSILFEQRFIQRRRLLRDLAPTEVFFGTFPAGLPEFF